MSRNPNTRKRGRGQKGQRPKNPKPLQKPVKYAITAEPGSQSSIFERIPELHPLREKTIAVAGLGCVGAPSVLEFAKCGVGELRLLDKDDLTPGNICRWPLGLPHAGVQKTELLRWFIENNYPFTRVSVDHYPQTEPGKSIKLGFEIGNHDLRFNEWECLEKLLDGADLIFDATAEVGVNQLLADMARERQIPYIFLSTRPGGWGGEVGRIVPGVTEGCYVCHLYNQEEEPTLIPPFKPDDAVQPFGCGDPTFTAASFDITQVSLTAVRMAVSTLCEGYEEAYPSIEGDIAILHLRNMGSGAAIFPRWDIFPLSRNPNCCLATG